MTITSASHELFMELARDAGNWSGTPLIWIDKEQRGNLTQLKRAGLLTTFTSDGDAFAEFTEAGFDYAKANGVDLDLYRTPSLYRDLPPS